MNPTPPNQGEKQATKTAARKVIRQYQHTLKKLAYPEDCSCLCHDLKAGFQSTSCEHCHPEEQFTPSSSPLEEKLVISNVFPDGDLFITKRDLLKETYPLLKELMDEEGWAQEQTYDFIAYIKSLIK